MKVTVHAYRKGVHMGNILWSGRWEMRGGKFPLDHPVGGGMAGGAQFGNSPAIERFRARGYWASCFPEGDGITWEPLANQDDEKCMADIRECFGWEIEP